jgi:hypothetical protein
MTSLEEVFLSINEELAPDLGTAGGKKQQEPLGNVNMSEDMRYSDHINKTKSD